MVWGQSFITKRIDVTSSTRTANHTALIRVHRHRTPTRTPHTTHPTRNTHHNNALTHPRTYTPGRVTTVRTVSSAEGGRLDCQLVMFANVRVLLVLGSTPARHYCTYIMTMMVPHNLCSPVLCIHTMSILLPRDSCTLLVHILDQSMHDTKTTSSSRVAMPERMKNVTAKCI